MARPTDRASIDRLRRVTRAVVASMVLTFVVSLAFLCAALYDRSLSDARNLSVAVQQFALRAVVTADLLSLRVRDMVLERGIEDFMMLDLSFPALMKMVRRGEKRVAVRVSEYEPTSGALMLAGAAEWVWLDVFHGFPLNPAETDALKRAGLRTCLVSPELHGRDVSEIVAMQQFMKSRGITVDAVCSKRCELW